MVLVIDNYDSFTYNLVQYLGELRADPRVIRNDAITLEEIAIMAPSHIVISPGPGTPDDAGISLDVVLTFAKTTPILGVCLGHQAIGQAFGGRIVRAPTSCTARRARSATMATRFSRACRTGFRLRATTRSSSTERASLRASKSRLRRPMAS